METNAQGNTQDTQPDINPYFLRYLREKVAKTTQEELASEIGVDIETVKHWETGRRQPSQKHLYCPPKFGPLPKPRLWYNLHNLVRFSE